MKVEDLEHLFPTLPLGMLDGIVGFRHELFRVLAARAKVSRNRHQLAAATHHLQGRFFNFGP